MPIAYYDIPTLNNMVFSKKLWMETVHENPYVKASLENRAYYGEDQHRDSSEVLLENVTIRVNDWWADDNNTILGSVDLLDTPKGLIVYNIAKSGMVGTSSRGFGDLVDIANGLQKVDEDSYLAVSQDTVCFPAVPSAFCLNTGNPVVDQSAESLKNLEKGLREQIETAIKEGYEKNPSNEWFSLMYNALNLNEHESKTFVMNPEPKKETFLMASSLDPRKAFQRKYPTNKNARGAFRK